MTTNEAQHSLERPNDRTLLTDCALLDLDPRKGTFRRYETPVHVLCTMEPIFGNQLLTNLVLEAQRRLRQLDRFLEEAWTHVHRSIAMKPTLQQLNDGSGWISADISRREIELASDAAEAFYLFGFRILDITRAINKHACNKEYLSPRPLNFMNVRNHLIIHPERNPGKVLSWSVYVTNQDNRGVVLKNRRSAPEEEGHIDPGLGPNSIELQRFLEQWVAALTIKLNTRQLESVQAPSEPT